MHILRLLVRQANDTDIPVPVLPDPLEDIDDQVPAHHVNAVVAFIIGLSIVTLASVLNAAGLNLTKLDHVRGTVNVVAAFLKWLVSVRCFCLTLRCAPMQFRRAREGRIGCVPYGSSACCFICSSLVICRSIQGVINFGLLQTISTYWLYPCSPIHASR